jgi:GTP:adenosylcobinamide-phosphate guanylyltransferase
MNEKSNMKNINIVIPSGGLGTRFSGSEFVELKPFIKFFGKTMFE